MLSFTHIVLTSYHIDAIINMVMRNINRINTYGDNYENKSQRM